MASLIPDIDEINSFHPSLTEGERTLMEALLEILDDSWTIYVQPYLNGLRPDIIIFSEDKKIGIFEVKDFSLDIYRIQEVDNKDYQWQVSVRQQGKSFWQDIDCPFAQAQKYKDSIIRWEIPILKSKSILNKSIYGYIKTFAYFHGSKRHDIDQQFQKIPKSKRQWFNFFSSEDIENKKYFKDILENQLKANVNVLKSVKEIDLSLRLANALAYPEYGNIRETLLKEFSSDQRKFLPNTMGKHIKLRGTAGSGKTFLIAHKAVNAALERKNVLVVCFNITMANYIRDLIVCLAREKKCRQCLQYIEVGHFHRFFPNKDTSKDRRNRQEAIDVLLIDEGQDFQKQWIEVLISVCRKQYHLFFCEDRRQNIYDRTIMPFVAYDLKESKRLPNSTIEIANLLSGYIKEQNTKDSPTITTYFQRELLVNNVWFNGNLHDCLEALKIDLAELKKARGDIAILVCGIGSLGETNQRYNDDGWLVQEILLNSPCLHLPYDSTFETFEEYKSLRKKYGDRDLENKLEEFRRGYKTGFWMKNGKIKLSTIHSFKGWEISNIFVIFNPSREQQSTKYELLYTAITRSQENLTIYNVDPDLYHFAETCISAGYMNRHKLDKFNNTSKKSKNVEEELDLDHINRVFMEVAYGYDSVDTNETFEEYLDSHGYE